MKFVSRRLGGAAAAVAIVAGGGIATAAPASAAFTDCHTNEVCLWAGTNGTGELLFRGDGSEMFNTGEFYESIGLANNPHAFSSSNRTLGTFCTYNSNKTITTNRLAPGTQGNLANNVTRYVKSC
ncbi:MAG TPA: peptidase inhibitor family I36 protein [Mycobacteriales bacterium]|nr:peptidase inhibitor family I36 protein [Mycobacteriales bacterium]